MPIGAYGGRREIMQHVLPAGKVFQAGTLSGNPVATAAGIATLKELRDNPPYERLEQLSARLEAGLRCGRDKAGMPHAITRVGSMLTLFFNAQRPTDWDIGQPERHGPLRQILLGPPGPRRLHALQPVRSPVRLRRPHRSRHRRDHAGGWRGDECVRVRECESNDSHPHDPHTLTPSHFPTALSPARLP